MVPVWLAPPPWANAAEPNDSVTNTARRPIVQRFMLSSSWGLNRRPKQHNQQQLPITPCRDVSGSNGQGYGRAGRIARAGLNDCLGNDCLGGGPETPGFGDL